VTDLPEPDFDVDVLDRAHDAAAGGELDREVGDVEERHGFGHRRFPSPPAPQPRPSSGASS
jgi:hypothetical protein